MCQVWWRYNPDSLFSLLRQEYPPILTSGEMLSHPGGWDKPIPEVIHLWRHRTSTPNNLEKTRLVGVLDIFCTFFDKNGKPCRGLQILDTRMGFPRPSLNVVLDSINIYCIHILIPIFAYCGLDLLWLCSNVLITMMIHVLSLVLCVCVCSGSFRWIFKLY